MLKSNYYINVGAIIFQSLKDEGPFNRAVSCSGALLESEAIIANVNHVGLGLPYNHSFHPDDEGFYCSELITYAFKAKQDEGYFQQYPMNFIDFTTQQALPYWISYYRLLNQVIPHGLPGSHPQQLLRQTHLFQKIQLIESFEKA